MTARDETEELLPCPFCGSPAEIIDIEDGENAGGSCVSCTRCEASSALDFGRKENFVSKWNTRPSPARDEGAGTMAGYSEVLNYVADMTYCGTDAEWHFKRGYDPQRVLDALDGLAAPVSAPVMDREEGAALDPKAWEVEVRLDGQSIITIGRSHLCGLSDIEPYGDVIRECAGHLLAFIGKAPQPGHCALGDDGCVCFFDHERCDNWRSGQEVSAPADGALEASSTLGTGGPIPSTPPFIQWNGGENPAPGKRVRVRLFEGSEYDTDSGDVFWWHKGSKYDVEGYRIIPTDDQGGEGT